MAGKAAFLVLTILVLAGCGGTTGSGSPSRSREEYTSKADAICREYYRRTDAIVADTFSELAPALDKVLPILDKALGEVHGLEPPESEQATVDQWLRLSDKVRADMKEMRDKARATLGPRFDLRDFHDAVLLCGAVPLTVLENVVNEYMAAKRNGGGGSRSSRH